MQITNNQIQRIEELRDINSSELSKELIINLNNKLTDKDLIIISSISRLKNPFKMLTVETVMKDLNICKTIAYRLFKRDDFPSINIGKNNQVMLLPYLIWKMNKKV